jgi:hypothetical protein
LPFIEQQPLFDLGVGLTGADRFAALGQRDATVLDLTNCPSRRDGGPYPNRAWGPAYSGTGTGTAGTYTAAQSARCDYAVSVGDETNFDGRCQGISPSQYNVSIAGFPPTSKQFTGVSFCGTAVKLRQITDGLTNTIALGERWVPVEVYEDQVHWDGDDWSQYTGFQDDMVRSTYYDGRIVTHVPRADREGVASLGTIAGQSTIPRELFGGPHPGGCLFSRCDGSVDNVEFEVDPEVFRQLGHRGDGGLPKVQPGPGPRQ